MFWTLFFAHLLGDYPLQSEWLVKNKRSLWGLSLHTAIHLAVALIVIGSAREEAWPKVLVLVFFHFLLDLMKSSLGNRWPEKSALLYVIDQALHVLSIFLVALWIERDLSPVLMPTNTVWPIYASGFLVVTYVWYITERIFTAGDTDYQRELKNQFWPRMVARAVLLTVFLFAGRGIEVAIGGMAIQLSFLSGSHRRRALVVDVLVSLVVAFFIHLAT